MLRSLYSGVSGLKVHQTKMDVIGNNIANVNTIGFKSSNVNFSDVFYQTSQSASGPNAATGTAGKNALQVGLGANVASIQKQITTQGGAQRTDNPLDVMISGEAFFVVNSGGTNYFTKDGAFTVDAAGNLCTSSGAYVMGWQVDTDGVSIRKGEVSPLQVMGSDKLFAQPEATQEVHMTGNIDSKDTNLETGLVVPVDFYDNLGNLYTAKYSINKTATDGTYTVGLTDVVDSKGDSIFVQKNATTGKYEAKTGVTVTLEGVTYASADFDIDEDTGKIKGLKTAKTNLPTAVFDPSSGEFRTMTTNGTAGTAALNSLNFKVVTTATAADNPFPAAGVNMDFSHLTQYAKNGTSSMKSIRGTEADGTSSGYAAGKMIGLSIDSSGKIYGSYDSGVKKLLGQIAVATFANASGLEAVGNNMFAETKNSGEFDGIGEDVSESGGMQTGAQEMSNVDLSTEFTSMITTQRGFQANSRIITTSDTLLEELINLKR